MNQIAAARHPFPFARKTPNAAMAIKKIMASATRRFAAIGSSGRSNARSATPTWPE
jgi:hypothetical protein